MSPIEMLIARSTPDRALPAELEDEPAGLLVVDDEPPILTAIGRTLRAEPYRIFTAESAREALEILEHERIGVIISDQRMSGMDGVQLLREVKERHPEIQRIMMTAHVDFPALQASVNQSEIFRFIQKPWDAHSLVRTVSSAFEQYRIVRVNERLWKLTELKNDELAQLNHDLEARIVRRTEQLARAKLEWEATFDAIVDPLAIVGGDHSVVRANVAYARAAQVEVRELPGRRCFEVLIGRDGPCVGCPLGEVLGGRPSSQVDVITGRGRTLEVTAYPLPPERSRSEERSLAELEQVEGTVARAVCSYRDVTDARAIAAELDRTRRLASLGLFVGGVAHEINNPLSSILAFTQILLDGVGARDPEIHEQLHEIESSAFRAKRIIESLQSFAQGSSMRYADIEVGPLIVEAVRAFSRDYGQGVAIDVEVAAGLPKVRGDALLLHQLLRNLLQNGEHAMAGVSGGALRVSAQRAGANDVALEVTDAGRGIPPDLLPRIYDPFFTTKQNRGGSGLGLSICHRIVEQHGGTIEARSTVGMGTTFRVTLRGVEPDDRMDVR